MNKTKCPQRKSPPPPPRHHNTDPFNIKNVVRVRWSDGVQRTRVSTGQLSRSHSQYYTASLLTSNPTTQMSVRLVNSDDRQQYIRFVRHKMCSVWERGGGEGLPGRDQGVGLKIVKVKEWEEQIYTLVNMRSSQFKITLNYWCLHERA